MNLMDKMLRAHHEAVMIGGGYWYEHGAQVTGNQRIMNWGPGNVSITGTGGMTGLDFPDPKNVALDPRAGVKAAGGGIAPNVAALQRGWGSTAFSLISPVTSAFFAYQGYQGNMSSRSGMTGLLDAVAMDYGTMLGLSLFGGPSINKIQQVAQGAAGPSVGFQVGSTFRLLRVGIGGNVGASIGNAIGGVPGAIAGGVMGGAAMGNPYAFAATALAGSAALVGYGSYSLLKTGYRHGRNIRLGNVPHTGGETASFFTQNAFTMRSKAVQAMRNSHLNARTALGQEATFMHTNKNYFSTYR